MTVHVLCAGHPLKPAESAWVDDYVRRIRRFSPLQIRQIREKPRPTPKATQEATWAEMEKRIPENSLRIILDERGRAVSTSELSDLFTRAGKEKKGRIAFVVGGAYGLPDSAKRSADALISLSRLTLPHRLAFLVLVEQVYRVLSWRAGNPYHHA